MNNKLLKILVILAILSLFSKEKIHIKLFIPRRNNMLKLTFNLNMILINMTHRILILSVKIIITQIQIFIRIIILMNTYTIISNIKIFQTKFLWVIKAKEFLFLNFLKVIIVICVSMKCPLLKMKASTTHTNVCTIFNITESITLTITILITIHKIKPNKISLKTKLNQNPILWEEKENLKENKDSYFKKQEIQALITPIKSQEEEILIRIKVLHSQKETETWKCIENSTVWNL